MHGKYTNNLLVKQDLAPKNATSIQGSKMIQ